MKAQERMAEARALDRKDPLRRWRDAFVFPEAVDGREPVYFCGNSLGLMPKRAREAVQEVLDDWGRLGVRGHHDAGHPWLPYHRRAAPLLAELAGAREDEVVAMNTLTANLHLLMVSFYRPTADRWKIVIESEAFPSDRYAVQSQLAWHGFDPAEGLLEWTPRPQETRLRLRDLQRLLEEQGEEIALLLLPGVQYYSGEALDMPALAALARAHGVVLGLDLAHAIGNVPLALHDWGADFAVWCSYKYLNGGPGAVAGAWVHERHLARADLPRWLGWWGHEEASRFLMDGEFRRAPGADVWQLSNPPILSLAPVIASLEIFCEAGIDALAAKSRSLTGRLEARLREHFGDAVGIVTPEARGCQLSLVARDLGIDGRTLHENLGRLNVIVDWREPDVIRAAPVPLYNSYEDVERFVAGLAEAVGMTQTIA